jgi:hypothetical protein
VLDEAVGRAEKVFATERDGERVPDEAEAACEGGPEALGEPLPDLHDELHEEREKMTLWDGVDARLADVGNEFKPVPLVEGNELLERVPRTEEVAEIMKLALGQTRGVGVTQGDGSAEILAGAVGTELTDTRELSENTTEAVTEPETRVDELVSADTEREKIEEAVGGSALGEERTDAVERSDAVAHGLPLTDPLLEGAAERLSRGLPLAVDEPHTRGETVPVPQEVGAAEPVIEIEDLRELQPETLMLSEERTVEDTDGHAVEEKEANALLLALAQAEGVCETRREPVATPETVIDVDPGALEDIVCATETLARSEKVNEEDAEEDDDGVTVTL